MELGWSGLQFFQSYNLGYRLKSPSEMLNDLETTLAGQLSKLHVAEAEYFVDLLANMNTTMYIAENSEENWKVILNTTSMLLNSSAVYRKEIKQKIYSLIRNISVEYSRRHLKRNSSDEFLSSTLIVKTWKMQKDYTNLSVSHPNGKWSLLHLEINACKTNGFEGNSSGVIVVILYKSSLLELSLFDALKDFYKYVSLSSFDDFMLTILVDSMKNNCDTNALIKVPLAHEGIFRNKRKVHNITCFKTSSEYGLHNLEVCENVEVTSDEIICQCRSMGLVTVVLLEMQHYIPVKNSLNEVMKLKLLPILGTVISVLFVLCTFKMFRLKDKFSSLFSL